MNPIEPSTPVALPHDDLRGLTIHLDAETRQLEEGMVLLGGSPLRIVRLSTAGRTMMRRLVTGEPVPGSPAATTLTRRLLDGGLAHPDWRGSPFTPSDVTVVVPVRGTIPTALIGAVLRDQPAALVVVDDASPTPVTVPPDSTTRVIVVRRQANGGPGAARNSGLARVRTPLTAFVDADCLPQPGWLDELLPHFADPLVAAAAPRIVAPHDDTTSTLGRYEKARSPLDLGSRPARVRARTRVPYVPSAALVVRTDVLHGLGGFDEDLRVGEDVDLVWRLDEAGWSVRYEPAATVTHHHRTRPTTWARRRFDYGTSAGPLALRHPGALVPLEAPLWSMATWVLTVTGHPMVAATVAATSFDVLSRRLASLEQPFPFAASIAARSHWSTARMAGDALVRPWWPLTLAACVASKRRTRVTLRGRAGPSLARMAPGATGPRPTAMGRVSAGRRRRLRHGGLDRLVARPHDRAPTTVVHQLAATGSLQPMAGRSSADRDQIDDEHQRLATLDDATRTSIAVALVGRDGEATATPDLHALHTLVPSGDDLTPSESEREGVTSIPRCVELLTGAPGHTDVVDGDIGPGRGFGAVTDLDVLHEELGGWGGVGNGHVGLAGLGHPVTVASVPRGGRRPAPDSGRELEGQHATHRRPRCPQGRRRPRPVPPSPHPPAPPARR